jgi:membrane-associated phospholipid phosphatase
MAGRALTRVWPVGALRGWRGQVALFGGAYLLYALGRYLTIGDYETAVHHAGLIVDAERALGITVERQVQGALQNTTWLWLLNHLYLAAQLVAVPAALVWLRLRAPGGYRRLRNVVLATWLVSLPVYALFPVAPPRLADPAMVDTITTQTGFALDSKLTTALYNPLAAVPSLHAGFALAVGVALARHARAPVARALAALWPVAVALAVVATGNHFLLDIAAGILATAAGLALSVLVERTRTLGPPARPRSRRHELPAGAPA